MTPSTRVALRRRLEPVLAPLGPALARAAVVAGHGALAVLVLTGESIRWVDYRDTLVSAPMLRATHALAGFVLLAALLLRVGSALTGALATGRGQGVPRPPAAFHLRGRLTAAGALHAAWWLVVGALALSGLERYLQLRHGAGLLPGLSPPAWWALHRPLLPYLYAILLLNAVIRGRIAARRVLSYLYTP